MKIRIASVDDTKDEGLMITYELVSQAGKVIGTKLIRIPWDAVAGKTIAEIKGIMFRHGREAVEQNTKLALKTILEGLEEDLK
ncbi:MAG: hypothetical protein ACE5H0_11560 [Bacteroidota bacterium]